MVFINFAIFNFILYSVIVYIIEGVYSYIIDGKFKEIGFLKGPYKPMYGIAFTILVIINYYFKLNTISSLILYLIIGMSLKKNF